MVVEEDLEDVEEVEVSTLYMLVMLEHLSWLHSTPTQGVPASPVSRLDTRPSTWGGEHILE